MAKTTHCAFCGKETIRGFLKGNTYDLFELKSGINIYCCEECFNQYGPSAQRVAKRFTTKYETIKKITKKNYSEKEIADMLLLYLKEEESQANKFGPQTLDCALNFFTFNKAGFFSVREYGKGFLNRDIRAIDMLKSVEKAQGDTDCFWFDKNDITKIEYAQDGSGSFVGFFKQVFSYAIRLNDEKVMTYKPCITRAFSYGGGFLFGYKKAAEKRLLGILNEFKKEIGSDLPIVKVKKI